MKRLFLSILSSVLALTAVAQTVTVSPLPQSVKWGEYAFTNDAQFYIVGANTAIEGFYGNPWSQTDRLRQFDFYGKNKMNIYVYGPKDDPYHRLHWRQPYPEKEAEQLKELVEAAYKNKVKFVWAIHPACDIVWGKEDYNNIVNKLNHMYEIGVRAFAVFFDDVSGEGTRADMQKDVMNYLTEEFVHKHSDVEPLIMCPSEYYKEGSKGDYLSTLSKMYPEVRIMWTGNSVVDMIQDHDMQWINDRIKRKAFIWLNGEYLTNLNAGPDKVGDYPVFVGERDWINPQRQEWVIERNDVTARYTNAKIELAGRGGEDYWQREGDRISRNGKGEYVFEIEKIK